MIPQTGTEDAAELLTCLHEVVEQELASSTPDVFEDVDGGDVSVPAPAAPEVEVPTIDWPSIIELARLHVDYKPPQWIISGLERPSTGC